MSACLAARTASIALRRRGGEPRIVSVVFPARWTKSAFLKYVRGEHPNETVRIVEWHSAELWLANPDGFTNYATGLRGA